MGLGFVKLFLSLCLISLLMGEAIAQAHPFKCSSGTTCNALVDYVHMSPNATTFSIIKKRFGVKNLRKILGVNNLPITTPQNQTLSQNERLKIPFPCVCSNGTGISNKRPVYTVQTDDFLYTIASVFFSGLVTPDQIGAANNFTNLNLIVPGERLLIPLPCSCDESGGQEVVHYGHVVEAGSSVELIANEYGTTEQILLTLNDMASAADLKAGQVLDVPIKACKSVVTNVSLDYPLLVPNSTYVFTANNCVKCKCDSANNYTLHCEPSEVEPSSWLTCPSMQCENNLILGNSTSSGCNQTTCAYAGYTNQTIIPTLVTESTCPTSDNTSSTISLQSSSWSILFIIIHFVFTLSSSF